MGMDSGVPEGDGSLRDAGVDATRDGAVDGHVDVGGATFDGGPEDVGALFVDSGLEDGSVFGDGSTGDGSTSTGDGSTGTEAGVADGGTGTGSDGGTGTGGDGSVHVDFDAGDADFDDASGGGLVDTGLIAPGQDGSVVLIDSDLAHLADVSAL